MAVPALAVSSDEVVLALQRAGFVVRHDRDSAVLDRGVRTVVVRHVPLLSPEELAAALRAAGLSFTDFLDRLSELGGRK
jgi:hypothetical protein